MDTRDLYRLIKGLEADRENNDIQLHDSFGLELSENFIIETGVVGFMPDGVIIQIDEDAMEYLDFNGVLLESEELDESGFGGVVGFVGKMLPGKKGPNPYDGANLKKGKSLGTALDDLRKYREANPEKFKDDEDDSSDTMDEAFSADELMKQSTELPTKFETNPALFSRVYHDVIAMIMDEEDLATDDPESDIAYSLQELGFRPEKNLVNKIIVRMEMEGVMDDLYDEPTYTPESDELSHIKRLSGTLDEEELDEVAREYWVVYVNDEGKLKFKNREDAVKAAATMRSVLPPGKRVEIKGEEHHTMSEAEYHGRTVPLGKPMQGDVKKSKVYVRKPNSKVVKVNFGDKTMRIKKSNPARRRSYRARHHCENPGPRWKANYWSCRAW
jgi:hypothetical protein